MFNEALSFRAVSAVPFTSNVLYSDPLCHLYRREAAILSHLNHPAIIRHVESFEASNNLCIVTEFAEKGDLTVRLAERKTRSVPFREVTLLDWFVQIALALLYLHNKKILHRDLKLANVFTSADNEVKLGDFGIARILKYTMECAKTVVGFVNLRPNPNRGLGRWYLRVHHCHLDRDENARQLASYMRSAPGTRGQGRGVRVAPPAYRHQLASSDTYCAHDCLSLTVSDRHSVTTSGSGKPC